MRKLMLTLPLLLLGCSVSPNFPSQADLYDEPRDYNRFAFLSYGHEVIGGRVDRGGVLGLDVNIGRYVDPDDHAIRGQIYGLFVDANIKGDHLEGFVGGLPLEMTVSRGESGLSGRGLVYGRKVELVLSETEARGKLGRCAIDLVRRGEVYVGRRSCGGIRGGDDVELQVGRGFRAWGDTERVAALSLMMFRN